MIMFLWLLFFVSFENVAYASLADDYLDLVLRDPLEQAIQDLKLDPVPLPDFTVHFKHDVGIVPVNGRVDFTNGIFNGLSKVSRFSLCDGPTLKLSEVKLECTMRFFDFSAVYNGRAFIEPLVLVPFQVTAYINETLVKSGVSGVPATLTGQITLLEIIKLGDIHARPSRLGLFQYVYNAVDEVFKNRIRNETTRILLNQFPKALGIALTKVMLPGLVN